jgi:hypothetical protein
MPADGDPLRLAQATSLIDNGNGTYTTYFDEYASHSPPDNLYEDISDWQLNTQYGNIKVYRKGDNSTNANYFDSVIYSGSLAAVIKPYEYNGKATYQLISVKPAP